MAMTLGAYRVLIERLKATGRVVGGVADFLESPGPDRVVLRHDVDRRPGKAIDLATLEAQAGVRSSFYFRTSGRRGFPEAAVRNIFAMGHEIGYHYETLSDSGGDRQRALRLFESNLLVLRSIAPCRTVSMHGRPLSRHNNEDLLRGVSLADFGLLGDATLSLQSYGPVYFTDVGGSWNHPHANLRDRVGEQMALGGDLADSRFLAQVLEAGRPLYLSTHPERWSEGALDWLYCRGKDAAVNALKVLIKQFRKSSRAALDRG